VTYLVWRNGEVQRVADLSAETCEK
jgi:hypothetical protein